jgi:uncharacterized protein YndB with AHSA1/START domain
MDFREGGHWHYAMVDPQGNEYWGYTEYLTIKPIDYYTALDAFTNEKAEINKDLPRANFNTAFFDKANNTQVEILISYKSLQDLETVIQMGMEQGMKATLDKLDILLSAIIDAVR